MSERLVQGRGIDGVVSVIPIPFDKDEEIDESALRMVVDFAVRCGVGAICLPAYGSEFYKLSDADRSRVIRIAVEAAAGRLLVIAQSNHGSAREALSIARANAAVGAHMISLAIPRVFPLHDDDLLQYLKTVLGGVDVPFLLQDFNPGGVTVTPDFVRRLKSECPNFHYIKLEEPVLGPKIQQIRESVGDSVGVLEGWGGMYMMELIPRGICGIMPGVSMADILNTVFDLRKNGHSKQAFDLFQVVLPQIVFSLQNMELYLYCEKRLLQARGVLTNARSRSACFTPDPATVKYVDELNERILDVLDRLPEFGRTRE